jgi:CDP-diacylglycerol--glycerol-3-phosphate 3-phosphatidyltransferase
MASIYDLKPTFQARLCPLVARLARAGATPNTVTLSALGLSIAAGAAIAIYPSARWPLAILPAALFVRMALNALDGMMARALNLTSRLGRALNEIGDVISDIAMYAPFGRIAALSPTAVSVAVILSVLTEIVGLAPTLAGGERRYDGPMGKSDRAVAFGLVAIVIAMGGRGAAWAPAILTGVIVLLAVTILTRAAHGFREVRR